MIERVSCLRPVLFDLFADHTRDPPMLNYVDMVCNSDNSISGFQFPYDINTIFWKYRDINIDIFKMMSM